MLLNEQSKKCSHCQQKKPLKEFDKNKYKKDGLYIYCKGCRKILRKNWSNGPPQKKKKKLKPKPIPTEKKCGYCLQVKPASEFHMRGVNQTDGKIGGKNALGSYCKACHNEYQRERVKKKKRERIRSGKSYKKTKNYKECKSQNARKKIKDELKALVFEEIHKNPHHNNNMIAEAVGTTTSFVRNERERLEDSGLIPFQDWYLDCNGFKRKRSLKRKKDEWTKVEVVYFIRAFDGNIKIGFTNNINERVGAGKVWRPEGLEVLLLIPGDMEMETNLHLKFEEHQIHGDWFRSSQEILAFIEQKLKEHPIENFKRNNVYEEQFKKREQENKQYHKGYQVKTPLIENPYAGEGKKQCGWCDKVLPFECFYKNAASYDSLSYRCRLCTYTNNKKHRKK